jgi:hypothetical protein
MKKIDWFLVILSALAIVFAVGLMSGIEAFINIAEMMPEWSFFIVLGAIVLMPVTVYFYLGLAKANTNVKKAKLLKKVRWTQGVIVIIVIALAILNYFRII